MSAYALITFFVRVHPTERSLKESIVFLRQLLLWELLSRFGASRRLVDQAVEQVPFLLPSHIFN